MRNFLKQLAISGRNRLARFNLPRQCRRLYVWAMRKRFTVHRMRACARRALSVAPSFCAQAIASAPGATVRTVKATPQGVWRALLFIVMSFVHVFGDASGYLLKNWKAFALMAMSLTLLTIGFVRLNDYTVPMLRGDFYSAGKGKTEFNVDDPDKTPMPSELFEQDSTFTKVVMTAWRFSWRATDTVVGDRVAAKYNFALELYNEGNYDQAVTALTRAFAALADKDGKVKPGNATLAAKIQFLIGNAYANSKKEGEAINAYQLSLTYDPDNLVTIYNLERLLSNGGKGGDDKGDKPKPVNPQNSKL